MTVEQERQVKALAAKILTQVDIMTAQMQGIINHSLSDVPLETIEQTFTVSIPHALERIQDMLGSEQEYEDTRKYKVAEVEEQDLEINMQHIYRMEESE